MLVQMGCFVAPLVFMFLNMASPVGGENSVYPVRASLHTECDPGISISSYILGAYLCSFADGVSLNNQMPQQPLMCMHELPMYS